MLAGGRPTRPVPWLPRTGRRRELVFGAFLVAAALLVLAGVADSKAHGAGQQWLGVLSAVPLALSAWRPLPAYRIAWLLALIGIATANPNESPPWRPVQIGTFLLTLAVVCTSQPLRRVVFIWLFSWIVTALGFATATGEPAASVPAAIVLAVLCGAAYQVSRRSLAQQRLAEVEEQASVLTERARIAREMHDVVAHHMSMLAVRAETAPFRLGGLDEPVRAEFTEIAAGAREAMTEMRRLLGVLRSDEPALATAPQPMLADLADLVAGARDAGTEVDLDQTGELAELSPALQLSAYRIVQESLTNAARHAPGAPVQVTVRRDGAVVEVVVLNGPPDRPVPPADGPGHGLRGMRERVEMLAGRWESGPEPDGGFKVTASLPAGADA